MGISGRAEKGHPPPKPNSNRKFLSCYLRKIYVKSTTDPGQDPTILPPWELVQGAM